MEDTDSNNSQIEKTSGEDLYTSLLELLDSNPKISKQDANIVKMLFGFRDGKEYTLDEVGEEFKLTRERIRQIRDEVLKRLKKPAKKLVLTLKGRGEKKAV